MTSKHINVNLGFTADTANAKQQIQTLQQQLNQLAIQPTGIGEKLTNEISQASHAAAELKLHLQNAINVNTGILDFSKLNQSIKKSGMTLTDYGAKLQSLGPKGQQAFMTLAQSVLQSEVAIKRSSTLLTSLGTTLMNTAKWQLSSTLLHGFIGSVSKAYNYAQDLNESLNRIRIVTGHNIDQMSKFAVEANKAAKALSTTTTAYTDASLIYYQQGLNDQEVKARAEVTLKLANVTAQSAEIVSDQMTAIWNNFYDGGKSLEYYADVITALGAATASSTDEISQGLEKFAAVADTVGLSYEYATAALATVTATTRQSADVVGTAFKTLFARIQDLDLGKTLDDGTTLGSYSEALMKVGINIKDTSGQLKDMDVLLEEMADKWDDLGQAEQVALAKSVAGVRQYTQLIALMDNWDFMEKNLKVVEKSSGTLQNQADIYAESWEAAKKRVRAASEELYSSLFDDKVFIKITDGFGSIIEKISSFVKSIGGLGGVISGLGLILTKVFSQQMTEGFKNLAHNIKMSTELGRYAEQQNKMKAVKSYATTMREKNLGTETEIQAYEQQAMAQEKLIAVSDRLTEEEREKYQILMDQGKAYANQAIELEKQASKLQEMRQNQSFTGMEKGMVVGKTTSQIVGYQKDLRTQAESYSEIEIKLKKIASEGKVTKTNIDEITAAFKQIKPSGDAAFDQALNDLNTIDPKTDDFKEALSRVSAELLKIKKTTINEMVDLQDDTTEVKQFKQALLEYLETATKQKVIANDAKIANDNMADSYQRVGDAAEKAAKRKKKADQDWATSLSTITSGLMSAGMLISSVNGLIDTLKSPDTSGWEKFGSVLTSVAMISFSVTGAVQGVIAIVKGLTTVVKEGTVAKLINVAADYLNAKSSKESAAGEAADAAATRKDTEEVNKNTAAKVANAAADKASSQRISFGKGRNKVTWNGQGPNANGDFMSTKGKTIKAKTAKQHGITNAWNKSQATAASTTTTGASTAASTATTTGATVTKTGTAKTVLNPGALKTVLKAAAPVAVLAAGIAALAIGLSKASEKMNEHELAAQKAANTAKYLSEQYENLKSEVAEFKTNLSNYNSEVEGLEKLTKGTVEYKEAIFEANEAALALIESNENLAYSTDSEGLITITKASLIEAQNENLKKMKTARAANLQGQINEKQARMEADRTNFNRKYAKSSQDEFGIEDEASLWKMGGGIAATAAGVGVGLAVSTGWIPVIGWALAAVGGLTAIIAGVQMANQNEEERVEIEALNDLAVEFQKVGNGIFTKSEIEKILTDENGTVYDEELVASLSVNASETQKMIEELVANTLAVHDNTKALLNENIDPEVGGLLTEAYTEEYKKIKEELDALAINITEKNTIEANNVSMLLERYETATGQKYNWSSDVIQKNEEGELVVYVKDPDSESGQKQLGTIESIKDTIATYEAQNSKTIQDLTNTTKFAVAQIEQSTSDNIGTIINQLINGNGTLESMTADYSESDITQLNALIAQYGDFSTFLSSVSGLSTEDIANMNLAFGSAEQVESFFQTYLESITGTAADLYKTSFEDLSIYLEDLFGSESMSEVLISDKAKIKDVLVNLYSEYGEAGVAMFNDVIDNLPYDKIGDFMDQFADIDFMNASAEDLNAIIISLGLQGQVTTQEFLKLVLALKQGAVTTESLVATYGKALADVNKLQEGAIISAEEFQTFETLGLENYFTIMYDGTYKLIRSLSLLKNAVKEEYNEQSNTIIEDNVAIIQKGLNSQETIKNEGLDPTKMDSLSAINYAPSENSRGITYAERKDENGKVIGFDVVEKIYDTEKEDALMSWVESDTFTDRTYGGGDGGFTLYPDEYQAPSADVLEYFPEMSNWESYYTVTADTGIYAGGDISGNRKTNVKLESGQFNYEKYYGESGSLYNNATAVANDAEDYSDGDYDIMPGYWYTGTAYPDYISNTGGELIIKDGGYEVETFTPTVGVVGPYVPTEEDDVMTETQWMHNTYNTSASGGDMLTSEAQLAMLYRKYVDDTAIFNTDNEVMNGKMQVMSLDPSSPSVNSMSYEDIVKQILESDENLITKTTSIDTDALQQRLDFMKAMGVEIKEEWTDFSSMIQNPDTYNAFLSAFDTAVETYNNLPATMAQAKENIEQAQDQIASTAEDLDELLRLDEKYGLGSAFDKYAMVFDRERESLNLDTEEIKDYVEYLQQTNTLLEEDIDLAEKSAKATLRMNDSIESIQENYMDWIDGLAKFKPGSEQYIKNLNSMKTAYADLLGVSEGSLSDSFVLNEKNLSLLNEAANGSSEALQELSHQAALDYIVSLDIDTTSMDKLSNFLSDHRDEIDNLEIGLDVNDENFLSELNSMIEKGEVKIHEVEEMLNMRGLTLNIEEVTTEEGGYKLPENYFDVEVPTTSVTTESTTTGVNRSYDVTVPDNFFTEGGTISMVETTTPGDEVTTESTTDVIGKVTGIQKYTAKASSASSTTSQSVKTASAASKAKKGKDGIERYKEITDAIDDVKHAADQAAKAADRLWGGARISALKEQNKQIEKQINLIKQEKAQAQQYLAQDKNNLNAAASNLGLEVSYGENGNVINATQLREQAYEEYNKYVDSVYADGIVSSQEEFEMDKKKTDLENFDKYLKQYDETKEKIEDLDDEMDEAFYQWQDNNFELWQEELELKISIDTRSLETAQYYFDKLSESFYTQAEAMGYLTSQINIIQNQYDDFYDSVEDLDKALANNDISQVKYIEGLEQMRDKALENAKSLQELDKQMMDYYGNTLKMGQTEISKYTDLMDNSSLVLDHYSSILKLAGKENDHQVMGQILESQAHTAKNEAIAAKESYDTFRAQADRAKLEYEKAKSDPSVMKEQLEILEKAWRDAEGVAAEEQEKMLTATENWAQKMQDVYNNDLAKFAQDLEKSLTGGTSYDWMKTSVERAQSSQEEYLTTTNKIYETNKMINEAQRKIDETTNTAAKKRLQAFQEETKQKQEQGKLSQFELDIQQAKYDLLLAEIALEEAQNAKSTVTLQRDAEGNYGYVYTADSDEVANAQQAVDDAGNALYNVQLEGANNYTQKMTDLMTEMGEALSNIRREDYASEEEWQAALDATRQYYFDKMEEYSNLYGIAVAEDGRVTEDAWSTAFSTMMTNTDTWQQNVNTYLNNVKGTVDNYYNDKENGLPAVLDLLGLKFEAVKNSVSPLDQAMGLLNGTSSTTYFKIQGLDTVTQNAKKSSDDYLKLLTGDNGIIKKTEEEATKVYNKTLEYSTWRDEVVKDIKEYEKLYEWLTKKIDDQVVNYGWQWHPDKPSDDDVPDLNGDAFYTADFTKIKDPPVLYGSILYTSSTQNFNDKVMKEGPVADDRTSFIRDSQGIADDIIADILGSGAMTLADINKEAKEVSDGTIGYTTWNRWFRADYIEEGKKLYDFISVIGNALGLTYTQAKQAYSVLFNGLDPTYEGKLWRSSGLSEFRKLIKGTIYENLSDDILNTIFEGGSSIYGYDTGGYTGEWGQAGKLAFLHEKEIVLNKEDTKNFLDAISILRSTNSITLDNILQQIENQIIQMSLTYTDLVNSLIFEKEKDVLQQEVSINVEFPNVTNSDEIERAFENIVNEAAQYAYRR